MPELPHLLTMYQLSAFALTPEVYITRTPDLSIYRLYPALAVLDLPNKNSKQARLSDMHQFMCTPRVHIITSCMLLSVHAHENYHLHNMNEFVRRLCYKATNKM